MASRSGHCLNERLGEIVVAVKMPFTRNKTERPREPLLYFDTGFCFSMCRITGRLRRGLVRALGAILEIPVLERRESNIIP